MTGNNGQLLEPIGYSHVLRYYNYKARELLHKAIIIDLFYDKIHAMQQWHCFVRLSNNADPKITTVHDGPSRTKLIFSVSGFMSVHYNVAPIVFITLCFRRCLTTYTSRKIDSMKSHATLWVDTDTLVVWPSQLLFENKLWSFLYEEETKYFRPHITNHWLPVCEGHTCRTRTVALQGYYTRR